MKAIVIPVKAFADAKSRLATILSPTARAELAEALCADIFHTITRVRGVERVIVVSSEARALDWARQRGWHTLVEERQISEAVSVDLACRYCEKAGVQLLLRIPTDIPLVHSSDIEEIFAEQAQSPACVIIPSRDGTGTNALLRSPPALFPSLFGRDSFPRHIAAARAAGATAKILRNRRIELDLDEPDDLELLRDAVDMSSHTGRWFAGWRTRTAVSWGGRSSEEEPFGGAGAPPLGGPVKPAHDKIGEPINGTDRAREAGSDPARFPKEQSA
jgi:2-phospho-L-lactate/phosphoenolpyruvate guanylyltransferase